MSANIQYDLEQLRKQTIDLLSASKESITSCLMAYHGSKFTIEKGEISRKTDDLFSVPLVLTDKETELLAKKNSVSKDIKHIRDDDHKIKTSPIDVTAFHEIQYYSAAVTNFKGNQLSKLKQDSAALDVKHLDKEAHLAAKKALEAGANEKLAIARYWISTVAVLLYKKNHPKLKSDVKKIDTELEKARNELSSILQTPRFDKPETSKVSAITPAQQTFIQMSSQKSSPTQITSTPSVYKQK